MIQAYAGDKMVVGVTRGNVERLTAGMPMRVQLVKSVTEVLIVFGEDKPAIIASLEAAGVEFSQVMKDSAANDPL